jgi:hypothetical protein
MHIAERKNVLDIFEKGDAEHEKSRFISTGGSFGGRRRVDGRSIKLS